MKKLQIMAWVLSALLLTGCGGSGTPTNTDNLPQAFLERTHRRRPNGSLTSNFYRLK